MHRDGAAPVPQAALLLTGIGPDPGCQTLPWQTLHSAGEGHKIEYVEEFIQFKLIFTKVISVY